MARDFSKRLERLEQLARDLVNQTVAHRFLPFDPDFTVDDYAACQLLMIDQMISDGEILPGQRVGFSRWRTKDEDAAASSRDAEAAAWSAVSPEAAAVAPPLDEPTQCIDDDLLAEAERHRKLIRPIDEIWPPPPGIV